MRIEVIDTNEGFNRLRANWERLYAQDPEAQFFLSWIWLSQLIERRPDNWCVLAVAQVDAADEYVAFLPLRLKSRFSKSLQIGLPEIYMAGNFWADYTGFVCPPGHEHDAIPALARHLRDEMSWERLHLENIRASQWRLALFTGQFPDKRFRITHRNR
ncbi:MAG: GNAT family N-acetyltransferase, partial [Gammaproteobacteria bacterium]|nr:GNAT family N-acetyltransferase [Gammaproteobacteria bacterium]